MSAIQLHIPDDLNKSLQTVTDDVESFIVLAIRNELARIQVASDEDVEAAAATDQSEEWLSEEERQYYMNLPDYV